MPTLTILDTTNLADLAPGPLRPPPLPYTRSLLDLTHVYHAAAAMQRKPTPADFGNVVRTIEAAKPLLVNTGSQYDVTTFKPFMHAINMENWNVAMTPEYMSAVLAAMPAGIQLTSYMPGPFGINDGPTGIVEGLIDDNPMKRPGWTPSKSDPVVAAALKYKERHPWVGKLWCICQTLYFGDPVAVLQLAESYAKLAAFVWPGKRLIYWTQGTAIDGSPLDDVTLQRFASILRGLNVDGACWGCAIWGRREMQRRWLRVLGIRV